MSCCSVVVCFIPVHWNRALCCAMIFAQHSARSSHVFSWTLPRHCLTKSLWQVMVRFQTSSSCALQNLIFKRGMTRIHQSSQLIRVFGAKQRFLQSAVRLCHFCWSVWGGVVVVCPSPFALGSFGSWSGWVVPFFGTWLGLIWCLRVFRTVWGTLVSVSCFVFGFSFLWNEFGSAFHLEGSAFSFSCCFSDVNFVHVSILSCRMKLIYNRNLRLEWLEIFGVPAQFSEGKFPTLIWNILAFSLCGTDAYAGWNY